MTIKRDHEATKVWVNSSAAADYLGVHVTTLATWRSMRIGPAFQRYENGAIRYRVTELEDYLSRTRCAGVSAAVAASNSR